MQDCGRRKECRCQRVRVNEELVQGTRFHLSSQKCRKAALHPHVGLPDSLWANGMREINCSSWISREADRVSGSHALDWWEARGLDVGDKLYQKVRRRGFNFMYIYIYIHVCIERERRAAFAVLITATCQAPTSSLLVWRYARWEMLQAQRCPEIWDRRCWNCFQTLVATFERRPPSLQSES